MGKKCSELINEAIRNFLNTHQFCNADLNKFALFLRKFVYPYEYMGSWEKFNETSIPPKELFCSELNLEDITNEDHAHVQTVWDVFEIKIRDKVIHYCLQMYLKTLEVSVLKYMDLILLIFLSALRLAWQSCLEKTGVNLELLTDIDMLLKVGEGTRSGICQAIYRYAKANNKHMGNYVKKNIISLVFGCKQLVWMGHVPKTSYK